MRIKTFAVPFVAVAAVGVGALWYYNVHPHSKKASPYQTINRNAAFHFHVPGDMAAYRIIGGTPRPVSNSRSVWLQYEGPYGYVSLYEGNQQHPDMLEAMTGGHPQLGSSKIKGIAWDRYRNSDDMLIHTFPDGVTVAVRTGSVAAERALASDLS
jgi:hypothetical protein